MLTEFCRHIDADYFNFLSFSPESTIKPGPSIESLRHPILKPSIVSKIVVFFLAGPFF